MLAGENKIQEQNNACYRVEGVGVGAEKYDILCTEYFWKDK